MACSNIVMQRLVDDSTSHIISFSAKCEAGQEATEYWSASNLMWQFRLLHPKGTWQNTRDEQGLSIPEHHGRVHRNYTYPPGTLTLRIDK
jgi:hypothetical protein